MLAIMNIGKYSSSGVTPSGTDLFTISASTSLGQAIDFYAKKGNIILGLPYMQNTIYRSADGGATWTSISSPYYLAHIFYSSIEDKFYALEMGDKDTETLHYGYSTDGSTWTWDTIYEESTEKIHIYGTFIEEANGTVAFDVLKIDSTNVVGFSYPAIASHLRVFINGTESVIGSTKEVKMNVSGSTAITDMYPALTYRQGKTKSAMIIEDWNATGYQYYGVEPITVGSWGVESEAPYLNQGYANGQKCLDNFYSSDQQYSGSSPRTYFVRIWYSPTGRTNTWTYDLSNPIQDSSKVAEKMYGFFQLGNYYYGAYKVNGSGGITKWYRAGNIDALVKVSMDDTFYKNDLTSEPVSELSLDSKHFLLSMSDGKIHLCEAT